MSNSPPSQFSSKAISLLRGAYHRYLKVRNLLSHIRSPFLAYAPSGHYSAPLPDLREMQQKSAQIFDRTLTEIPGLDLQIQKQIGLLGAFSNYCADFPFQSGAHLRYQYPNMYFGMSDSAVLYSVMRHFRPEKIVEIGSGYSSAVMLDVNDLFFGGDIELTFMEPYPERLNSLIENGGNPDRQANKIRHKIFHALVQEVPLTIFQELKKNDILFIDSSHLLKPGSDVAHIFYNVLPTLAPGVIIHFHDILWPFEYPIDWYFKGIFCNEAHYLRVFLQYNNHFQILFFNNYMTAHHAETCRKSMSPLLFDTTTSLWLQRVI
jgi:predicted O-methyltransferase YrrM